MDEETGMWLNYGSITDPSRDRESVIHRMPLTAIEREVKYIEADIDYEEEEEVVEDVTKEMIEHISGELFSHKKQRAEEKRIRRENRKTH